MRRVVPEKLKPGNEVRVVAPARSIKLPFISEEIKAKARENFERMGLKLSFGRHVEESDPVFTSASVKSRVEDLNEAFRDRNVKAIITVIGGFNSNEILPHLDYSLIAANPKILCGYSDITALANAIYTRTGLVTYSGPHWFDFGWNREIDYTMEYFKRCLFSSTPYEVKPSVEWSDYSYDFGKPQRNEGAYVLREGRCTGTIVGANLITFQHLAGTKFMPSLRGKILFLEDDQQENLVTFTSTLTALSLLPDFKGVKGIVFGRFQPASKLGKGELSEIVKINERFQFPIVGGFDFGHTTSKITFPIGGTAKISAGAKEGARLWIRVH